jgi:4-hydroxyphenylpyruvate dioxygenase
MTMRLSLHTWTLDTTPLPDALAVIKKTGWDAVELRRLDFERAAQAGQSAEQVLALVRASGLPVACVGVELGWVWATGEERARLLRVFAEQAARARALGCATIMSPVDRGRGDVAEAARSIREVGDIAREHGVRLAVEFNSQCEQLNALGPMREVMARAGHPQTGLLLDTYHLGRTGASPRDIEDVRPEEIAYVQYSDVPRTGLEPGKALDRLPPGQGSVPFRELFAAFIRKGYAGYASYEAPNPAAWKRPAEDVAREALAATRAVLP